MYFTIFSHPPAFSKNFNATAALVQICSSSAHRCTIFVAGLGSVSMSLTMAYRPRSLSALSHSLVLKQTMTLASFAARLTGKTWSIHTHVKRGTAVAGDALVIVDYATSTCGPCKLLAPKYDQLSELYDECCFYNVIGDRSRDTKKLFVSQGVSTVPTIHLFKNSERRSELAGAKLTSIDIIDAIEGLRWE